MNLKEIKFYISNWNIYLKQFGTKGLINKLHLFESFDFNCEKLLGSSSSYVHVYIGISKDLEKVKLFVISDNFDSKKQEMKLEDHIYISNPIKFNTDEKLSEEIDEKKALKRIQRWKKSPKKYLKGELSDEYNAVRCFMIPTEDLLTPLNRAYFSIKKAKDIKGLDYQIDLIIKNIDISGVHESSTSYDTIRLVPPFPPSTENFYLLDIDE